MIVRPEGSALRARTATDRRSARSASDQMLRTYSSLEVVALRRSAQASRQSNGPSCRWLVSSLPRADDVLVVLDAGHQAGEGARLDRWRGRLGSLAEDGHQVVPATSGGSVDLATDRSPCSVRPRPLQRSNAPRAACWPTPRAERCTAPSRPHARHPRCRRSGHASVYRRTPSP